MAARIDAHHHFWKYSPLEHAWLEARELEPLRRDFLTEHLLGPLASAAIDGVVTVQVRQSLAENEWLLDVANASNLIRGVVGWAPLVDAGVDGVLERFASESKFKGVRHLVQDEPDERFLLRDDFNRGVGRLARYRLAYDILIYERQLPAAIEFVDHHPDQVFVLDHLAKPCIRERQLSPWRENLVRLAERPNVYCKLSGLVTEADWHAWRPEDLRPYIEVALENFGPQRLMFGSDWPVMLLAAEYARWFNVVRQSIAQLSEAEQAMILGETAAVAYHL